MDAQKKFDLLSMGEILLRLSPLPNEKLARGELLEKRIGGAELNVAAGVAMLGLRTGFISKIPDNKIGDFANNTLHYYGISGDYLLRDTNKDARLGIYYYEGAAAPGKPAVVYDRRHSSALSLTSDELPGEIYRSTRAFHTTGITLALGGAIRETAVDAIRRFKEAGALVSFDVNFRANLWSEEEARESVNRILPYVDVFFCSETTARLTFGKKGGLRDIMKSFTEDYPISVVASTERIVHSPKCHTFGSVIYDAKQDAFYEEEPYRNIEIVDRIGSGDAYIAGVLYGLLGHNGDCRKALAYGNAYSAMKNTVPGDLPFCTRKEIDRIIARHHDGDGAEMDR